MFGAIWCFLFHRSKLAFDSGMDFVARKSNGDIVGRSKCLACTKWMARQITGFHFDTMIVEE